MKTRKKLILPIVPVVLILAGLACNLFPQVPEIPKETIPVTTEAVEDLQKELQEAAQVAQETGKISVSISEPELTSLLTFELQKQSNLPLTQTQVYLREGLILVTGIVQQEETSLPVSIAVAVSVTAEGRPSFSISAAQLGSLPLPQPMVEQFSAEMERAFQENISPRMGEMVIETITIADGVMTISGRTR